MKEEEFQKYREKFYGNIVPKDREELFRMLGAVMNKYDKGKTNPMETGVKMMILVNNFVEGYIGKKFDLDQMDLVYMMIKKHARMGLFFYNAEDVFYPQYDGKFHDWIEELATSPEFIREAKDKLAKFPIGDRKKLHRWKLIADQETNEKEIVEVDENNEPIQKEEPEVIAQ